MVEPESTALTQKQHEFALYANVFAECLPSMQAFLDALFASIFRTWGALVLVAIDGDDDYRAIESSPERAPFCQAVDDMHLRNFCIDCDRRRAHEVAGLRSPMEYWCDWGLREIAVPILVHDVAVGVILCGQKRLEGAEDLEGKHLFEEFASKKGLESISPELREKYLGNLRTLREQCSPVSPEKTKDMVAILWAASQFISQRLYDKLGETADSEQPVADALKSLFAGFEELNGNHQTPSRFWNALDKQLVSLSTMFESRCLAVVLEEEGQFRVVSSQGIGRARVQPPPNAILVTSSVKSFALPEHLEVSDPACAGCFLTSRITEEYPDINLVVFDKAKLGTDRILHFLVYFDPTVPRHNRLLLHQKKQILSLFLRETANSYLHTERVKELQTALKKESDLLLDVVHQINQPLHGILADSENLIKAEYPPDKKAKVVRYLPFRAKQLAMQVRSVQLAAQDGKLRAPKLNLSNVNLSRFLIDNAMIYQGLADEKWVRIEVIAATSDAIGEVCIDSEYVMMALTNVVFNAVKYAFPGTAVNLRSEVANQKLRILVEDTGVEIKPEERELIFEKGKRTKTARNFSESGLGIGSYVTRELMRSMGGDAMVVDSVPTTGMYKQFQAHRTTIALTLPHSVVLQPGGNCR